MSTNPKPRAIAGLGALLASASLLCAAHPAVADDPCCSDDEVIDCQDGLWCTGDESCNCWGDCEPGIPRNCNDGDWCTDDYCINDTITPGTDFGTGHCEHANRCRNCVVDADCDDANACTTEVCHSDICFYTDVVCNDSLICTEDTCDPGIGCVFTDVCVDPDLCNDAYCDVGTNACEVIPVDCDDTEVCTLDLCNPATGLCSNTLRYVGCCDEDGDCVDDGYDCTIESCEPCTATTCAGCLAAGTCTLADSICVSIPTPWHDTCNTTFAAMGYAGGIWSEDGETVCNTHTYGTGSPNPQPTGVSGCSGFVNGHPDAYHRLNIPTDTDYQLYKYHLEVTDPLTFFDPVCCLVYPYEQSGDQCGVGGVDVSAALDPGRVLVCDEDNAWGHCTGGDFTGTESCGGDYRWRLNAGDRKFPVLPDGNYSIVVDSDAASPAGGDYSVALERDGPATNRYCNASGAADEVDPVEIMMGGIWTGNTWDYGETSTLRGVGTCTDREYRTSGGGWPTQGNCLEYHFSGGCGCNGASDFERCFVKQYSRAEFIIDHSIAPWNRNMGYIIETEVPGVQGFDTAVSINAGGCNKNCGCGGDLSAAGGWVCQAGGGSGGDSRGCPVGCDNDAGAGTGSRLVTGVIPSGALATISLHSHYPVPASHTASNPHEGNYKMIVRLDSDGDGVPDESDPSSAKYGDTTADPIVIPSLPFLDSRNSGDYANNYQRSYMVYGEWRSGWRNPSYRNTTGGDVVYRWNGGGTVRACLRSIANDGIWDGAYRWDGWVPVLYYRIGTGGWTSAEGFCHVENDVKFNVGDERDVYTCDIKFTTADVNIGTGGGTLDIVVDGVLPRSWSTSKDDEGYYNFGLCAGCSCSSFWDPGI